MFSRRLFREPSLTAQAAVTPLFQQLPRATPRASGLSPRRAGALQKPHVRSPETLGTARGISLGGSKSRTLLSVFLGSIPLLPVFTYFCAKHLLGFHTLTPCQDPPSALGLSNTADITLVHTELTFWQKRRVIGSSCRSGGHIPPLNCKTGVFVCFVQHLDSQ